MPTAFIHPRTMYEDGYGNSFSDPKEAADSVKAHSATEKILNVLNDEVGLGGTLEEEMKETLLKNWQKLRTILNDANDLDVQVAKG